MTHRLQCQVTGPCAVQADRRVSTEAVTHGVRFGSSTGPAITITCFFFFVGAGETDDAVSATTTPLDSSPHLAPPLATKDDVITTAMQPPKVQLVMTSAQQLARRR
jgi:hypothetical protein